MLPALQGTSDPEANDLAALSFGKSSSGIGQLKAELESIIQAPTMFGSSRT